MFIEFLKSFMGMGEVTFAAHSFYILYALSFGSILAPPRLCLAKNSCGPQLSLERPTDTSEFVCQLHDQDGNSLEAAVAPELFESRTNCRQPFGAHRTRIALQTVRGAFQGGRVAARDIVFQLGHTEL